MMLVYCLMQILLTLGSSRSTLVVGTPLVLVFLVDLTVTPSLVP